MGRVLVPCIQQHRHPSVCLSMMKLYSTQQLLLKARLEPGTDVVAGINFSKSTIDARIAQFHGGAIFLFILCDEGQRRIL